MTSVLETWNRMNLRSRIGLGIGCLIIVGMMVAVGLWAYRPDYQVLFSDMAPRDAAAMTAELDKMKTPYQLGEGGTAILVSKDLVYKTRLTLMGKDLPLHGAVGFEVFNNADFGMTEFVQKVNYLRAIQGELTRTILAIEDIQSARVHLAIPEQGLFKKAVTKPKASVTLGMKPGRVLAAEQVAGIQRLVAASVPDIRYADVTVIDQHGVALTRISGGEAVAEMGVSQLDIKRSTEDYLVKKVGQVLDRTFGAGEAIASVDVTLNLDHGNVTTEEVLPAKGGSQDASPTGVVVRERHIVREGESATAGASAKPESGQENSTSEADYQVGRRVEQLAIAGGTVKRMTIAVVIKRPLSEGQRDKLREVVALAVGFSAQRGDAIVLHTIDSLVAAGAVPTAEAPAQVAVPQGSDAAQRAPDPESATVVPWVLVALLAAVSAAGVFLAMRRRMAVRPRLSRAEREKMLLEVRQWIDAPAMSDGAAGRRQ